MKKLEKRTKVYLLDRTKIADPVNFSPGSATDFCFFDTVTKDG